MEIHLEKCILRPWKAGDVDSLAKSANNTNVAFFLRDVFPSPYSVKDAEYFISQVIEFNRNQLILAIVVDQKAVGSIGGHFQNDVYSGTVEIGYWLDEQYWGKGIVTDAVKWITQYIFTYYEIRKIYAAVFDKNLASVKVLEKCGFEQEAILKKAVSKNGIIMDELIFSRFQ